MANLKNKSNIDIGWKETYKKNIKQSLIQKLFRQYSPWPESLRIFKYRRKFVYWQTPMRFSNNKITNGITLFNHCKNFESDILFTNEDGETVLRHDIISEDEDGVTWIDIDDFAERNEILFCYYGKL